MKHGTNGSFVPSPEEIAAAEAAAAAAERRRSLLQVRFGEGEDQRRELQQVNGNKPVKTNFESGKQLLGVLEENRHDVVDVYVDDVIDMVAELRSATRASMLETAVIAWFYHALGFRVLEVECHEQAGSDDSSSGFLLFRIRLDANYDNEVNSLHEGQDLSHKFRGALIRALPGDLAAKRQDGQASLEQMVQISWTKCGSIELGGVCALGLVMLIVMAIGIGMLRGCNCGGFCPCVHRKGVSEGVEYHNALAELRCRGAEFEVNPDGSASIKVPPHRDMHVKWRCPDCCLL